MTLIIQALRKARGFYRTILRQMYLWWGGRLVSILHKNKKHKEEYPIDFVVTWVDGNDPDWRREKQKYAGQITDRAANAEARYRDWDTLVYWFRAVEKYAPWVNHVYFVTCGQKPSWLNLNNEKLRFVTHEEFIPKEYLPTFSCPPIELNLWRIPGLSEHFVYFNDDMFLNRPVRPEDFFQNGLPLECAIAKPLYVADDGNIPWQRSLLNDYAVINSSFNIRQCIRSHPSKWFSYVIGSDAKYNRRLYYDGYVVGMVHPHSSRAFLKKTYEDLWSKKVEVMDRTSRSKFRDNNGVTNQLVALWMIFSGDFYPIKRRDLEDMYVISTKTIQSAINALNASQHYVLCLNDGEKTESSEFENLKQSILEALAKKFPDKSSFEL